MLGAKRDDRLELHGVTGHERQTDTLHDDATMICVSIIANALPMQRRGPPPKGKYAFFGRPSERSGVKRSGSKPSGLSQCAAVRCSAKGLMPTMAFFGRE